MVLRFVVKQKARFAKENSMAKKEKINLKTVQEWDAGKKAKKLRDVTPMPVDTMDVAKKAETLRMIRAGDMSPETKALPDEVVAPPKGVGESEKDMDPIPAKKKGGKVKCMVRGGGIEVRGKTRGKIC